MSVPKWSYSFTQIPSRRHINAIALLRDMHRAWLLGAEVRELQVDGKPISENALVRLNLWIQAGGAWKSTRGEYVDAWGRLEAVISPPVDPQRLLRRSPGGVRESS